MASSVARVASCVALAGERSGRAVLVLALPKSLRDGSSMAKWCCNPSEVPSAPAVLRTAPCLPARLGMRREITHCVRIVHVNLRV